MAEVDSETQETNPYREPIAIFFKAIVPLNGIRVVSESQFGKTLEEVQKITKTKAGDGNLALYRLLFQDLSGPPRERWKIKYGTLPDKVRGVSYMQTLSASMYRMRATFILQGYEAFKKCVTDMLAAYLFLNRGKAPRKELGEFEKNPKNKGLEQDTLEFWKLFVRDKFRSADDILKKFRGELKGFTKAEKGADRSNDFDEWFRHVSKVRHAATHTGYIVESEVTAEWKDEEYLRFYGRFSCSNCPEGLALSIKETQCANALEAFCSHTILVYKALCRHNRLDWTVGINDIIDSGSGGSIRITRPCYVLFPMTPSRFLSMRHTKAR